MKKGYLLVIGMLAILYLGCKSEYTRTVQNALESGEIFDSLIFGMRMGQSKEDYFKMCWNLNKTAGISDGTGDMSVKYLEPFDSTKDMSLRKQMYFYGVFDEKDTLRGINMTYNYMAWAPWNLKCSADSLAVELKSIYSERYPGSEFMDIDLDIENYQALVKIDGNRQILIYPKSAMEVVVKIEDLRFKYKNK